MVWLLIRYLRTLSSDKGNNKVETHSLTHSQREKSYDRILHLKRQDSQSSVTLTSPVRSVGLRK